MARWLSWLERRPVTAEVVGSNPIRVALLKRRNNFISGVLAQLGEHLPYKQRVIGSSPIGPISFADVAQLAEQLICNQQVIGSSPIIGLGESQFHMDGFPSGQRGQTVNLLRHASVVRIHLHPFKISIDILILIVYNRNVNIDAGWSSLEARRAHNPKVAGSNPAPAIYTSILCISPDSSVGRAED